jgi:hypothetical protein
MTIIKTKDDKPKKGKMPTTPMRGKLGKQVAEAEKQFVEQVQAQAFIEQRQIQIEYKPIEQLIPYAMNARKHSDEEVDKLASWIKEVNFL